MTISFIDLHKSDDTTEPDKIVAHLSKYREIHTTRLFHENITEYNPHRYDGIVFSGSDDSKQLESEQTAMLKPKIMDAVNSGIPILGICGGHQLLATYFGYRIYRVEEGEAGWPEVYLTSLGINDALFKGLPAVIRPFQYHQKAVAITDESKILAKNERFVQSILYAPNARGVQFHSEESQKSGMAFLKGSKSHRDIAHTFYPPEDYVEHLIFRNFAEMTQ